jgi:hypothetical protein
VGAETSRGSSGTQGVARRNGVQVQVSVRGRPSKRPGASSLVGYMYPGADRIGYANNDVYIRGRANSVLEQFMFCDHYP